MMLSPHGDVYPITINPQHSPPSGWSWASLPAVARLESGHTPSRREPSYWDGGDVPWVSLKDIRGLSSKYITETVDRPTMLGIDNSSARVLPKGTVAFCRTASVGHVVILGCDMATSQDFVNWVCGPTVHPEFLYWAFRSSVPEFDRIKQGSTHKTIYMPVAERFQVLLPPLSEQKRIAGILDQADGLRRKRQQALALTDQFLRSTFLDLFGDPVTNPKRWPVAKVSEFVRELEGGKNIKTDDAPSESTRHFILKVSAVTWGEFRPEESKPVPPNFVPPESYLVKTGDLLMSRANTRELIGATVFVHETPPDMILPDKIWRFVWRQPLKVTPHFVHALFNHHSVRAEMGRRASGTSGSMKNISKPKVLSMEMPLPPLDLQMKFAKVVEQLRRVRCSNLESGTEFDGLFNSLVQRSFRGEL